MEVYFKDVSGVDGRLVVLVLEASLHSCSHEFTRALEL